MTDDAKAALTYLKALPLVTKHDGVVVGASIGGRKALELLVSEQGIGSVVLLSSRLNDDALGIIRESPKVAVLSVAASDDPNGGTYAAMSEAAVASEHPHSKFLHFAGVEHGAPLLKANSGLEDDIVRWLVERPGFL